MKNWTLVDFRCSKASLNDYLQYLNKVERELCGSEYINEILSENDERYYTIELSNWNDAKKELLFLETIKGIYYYFNFHSKKSSFPVCGYNNLKAAINGSDNIQVYKKNISNFSDRLIYFLVQKKVILGRPKTSKLNFSRENNYNGNTWLEDAAGTNDPETMNDVYWNLD